VLPRYLFVGLAQAPLRPMNVHIKLTALHLSKRAASIVRGAHIIAEYYVHKVLTNNRCVPHQLVTCVPCKRCFLPCAGWLSAQVRVIWNENLLELSLSLAHFFALSLSWQIVAAVAAIAEILLRLRAKVHFHSVSKTSQLHRPYWACLVNISLFSGHPLA
jgi:hypothetical protein